MINVYDYFMTYQTDDGMTLDNYNKQLWLMCDRSIIAWNGHFLCHQYSATLVEMIKATTGDTLTA